MRGCDRLIKVLDGGGREWAGGYVRGWGGGEGEAGGELMDRDKIHTATT
jgi:hypothetical protein